MKIKEQMLRKSIKEARKQLDKINVILDSNPYSDIIYARIEYQKLLQENNTLAKRLSKEFSSRLDELSQIEERALKMVEKQKKSSELIDKKVKLQFELRELEYELWYITRKF